MNKILALCVFASLSLGANASGNECARGVIVGMLVQQQTGALLTELPTENALEYFKITGKSLQGEGGFSLKVALQVYSHAVDNKMPKLDPESFLAIGRAYFKSLCEVQK